MRLQQARWLRQDYLRTLGLIVCLLAILMTACGGTSQSGSAQKATDDKQVFVYPISGKDISTFDPATAEDNASVVASGMVFTGLVQVDENQKLIKQLAESYSVANDGLTWTFKLRPNLKFSDGSSLTAQDVLYSINRALDPNLIAVTCPADLSCPSAQLAGRLRTSQSGGRAPSPACPLEETPSTPLCACQSGYTQPQSCLRQRQPGRTSSAGLGRLYETL